MEESTVGTKWNSLPFYRRLIIAGLLVEALILITVSVLTIAVMDPTLAVFLAIFFVPSLLFAWLLWAFGRKALIGATIWAVLSLLTAALFLLLPSLAHPSSFFDIFISLPTTVALVVAVVGCIVSIRQQRQGTVRTESTGRERQVIWAVTLVTVALVMGSGALHLEALSTVSDSDRLGAVEVDMKDVEFIPDTMRIQAGRETKIVVKNSDLPVHTFSIKALDIDAVVVAGNEKLVTLPPLEAGTYEYICKIEGHEDMKGTITVAPAASG